MKTDIQIQNEKLHADMLTYRDQRNKLASQALHAEHALQQAHKAIFELVKNIETVRYLADHDMKALKGLGCLPLGAIPKDVSLNSEAWESLMTFRNAVIN